MLRGFRQVIPRGRDTFFPTESAECKNFAEMVRPMTRKSWSKSTLQLLVVLFISIAIFDFKPEGS